MKSKSWNEMLNYHQEQYIMWFSMWWDGGWAGGKFDPTYALYISILNWMVQVVNGEVKVVIRVVQTHFHKT